MLQSHPQYRINYRFCTQPQHSDQKTNLVCLSSQCQQSPLICSFCVQDKHKGHQTKPLKHFLANLEKHYAQHQKSTVGQELEDAENGKLFWLGKIKSMVQTLADAFMKLEQQVINRYEVIKSQIFDRQAKRSRFHAFYESMAIQGKGDPNFEIQNYLHFEPLQQFEQPEQTLDSLTKKWRQTLENMRNQITVMRKDNVFTENSENQVISLVNQPNNNHFIMPVSIKRTGNKFLQTNFSTKQSLGHLDVLLKNWTGKIKIKVLTLKPNAKFALGVAKLTDIVTSKTVDQLKKKHGVFYFDSTGVTQLQEYNYIPSLKEGESLNVFVKKSNMKIVHQNSKICCHHLKSKEQNVVYFSMEGNCQVQMIYPFYKGA